MKRRASILTQVVSQVLPITQQYSSHRQAVLTAELLHISKCIGNFGHISLMISLIAITNHPASSDYSKHHILTNMGSSFTLVPEISTDWPYPNRIRISEPHTGA